MRTSTGVFCAGAIVTAILVCCWQVRDARSQIMEAARLILASRHLDRDRGTMSYASIVFTSGTNTTTYTDVTNYTAHETYVSFTGKGPGDDNPKSYEINRSTFDSVKKNPVV